MSAPIAAVDPLHALQGALQAPAGSAAQAEQLSVLRASLEATPGRIPLLAGTLLGPNLRADSLLRRWVLDLLAFGLARAPLAPEPRVQLAQQSFEALTPLLDEPHPPTTKLVIQCFTAIYPVLFRWFCTNRHARPQWDALVQTKARILDLVGAPAAPTGVRVAALKFAQRVAVVHTKGANDPRRMTDPNVAMVPSDHPFMHVPSIEQEAIRLLQSVINLLYTSTDVDLLTAMLNSWAPLAKLRPALTQLVVQSLADWTPGALAGLPFNAVKSVEKAVRILLVHLSRTPTAAPLLAQINEALAQQSYRMDRAAADERARRAAPMPAPASASPTPTPAPDERKRPALGLLAGAAPEKRARTATPDGDGARAWWAAFDYAALPASLVTDVIVGALGALNAPALAALVDAHRAGRPPPTLPGLATAGAAPPPAPAPVPVPVPALAAVSADPRVKEEPPEAPELEVAPAREIDTEEMEYEPDALNATLAAPDGDGDADVDVPEAEADADGGAKLALRALALPPPRTLGEDERHALAVRALGRLWADAAPATGAELWMLLAVRGVTRVQTRRPPSPPPKTEDDAEDGAEGAEGKWVEVYERQDRLRQVLADYVLADFGARVRLASAWMNEEWYNDRVRGAREPDFRANYETWLGTLVAALQTHLDARDRTFSRFLLDLPYVPPDVMALLRELCVEPERREVGFTTLRGFVTQRPTLRDEAMTALMDLTTHPEKLTRAAAINTVRRWVPDGVPMADMAREFALQLLRRLRAPGTGDGEMDEDGQLVPDELVQTPYLPPVLTLPAKRTEVLQHVEFVFALCVKVPELLAEIFEAYGVMDGSVQALLQELVTPLVRSLGPGHAQLLMCLRRFPPGADGLVLRVLRIFTDGGARPSAPLVALVKALVADRDLDVRFLVPIIGEMDKVEIIKNLPRVVGTLDGTQANKDLVRTVFASIVQTPAQTFGSVTSNLPRGPQGELLSPKELMVLLHESEDIERKSAMEAITLCFSMTDVFRSDVLGAVMQQIVDQPTLPTLFLRTVIQAVTTYKSLVVFVSTTIFNRLIVKKVWTHPALWEGFIRCAKLIAPASYAALLQLPKEQLRDVVARQPSLKAGLREHVAKNARGNKARMAAYADIFGEDAPAPAPAAQGQEPPAAMQGQEATSVPAIPGQEPAPAAAS